MRYARQIGIVAALLACVIGSAQAYAQELTPGNSIVVPPAPQPEVKTQSGSGGNVTVNITPPAPDPQATQAMYDFTIAHSEYDHVQGPVSWVNGLLQGNNIWTETPRSDFDQGWVANMRKVTTSIAIGLFLLAVLWTGLQIVLGASQGFTSVMTLFPMLLTGLILAIYGHAIAMSAVDLNNAICHALAQPSLTDFVGDTTKLPEIPQDTTPSDFIGQEAQFITQLLGSLVMAIVLAVLALKMIFREAVLIVGDVVAPISGILFAVGISKGWGRKLFMMFYGWLFGQPLVVLCIAMAGTLLDILHTPTAGEFLVKLALMFLAVKMVSFFAESVGSPGIFGLAGLMLLMRQGRGLANRMRGAGGGGAAAVAASNTPSRPSNSAAVQGGNNGGTGSGSAATGRPWRPAYGEA